MSDNLDGPGKWTAISGYSRWLIAGWLAVAGCSDDDDRFSSQRDPAIGATRFVSAASNLGQQFSGPRTDTGADENATDGDTGRKIEEGDIYRVMDAGLLLNLNAYRGLQVIDVSDPSEPSIVGALRVAGTPVELYAMGDRAIVLLNDWYGYAGDETSSLVEREQGGVILLVDLSDPANPQIADREVVPGYLMKSRLARGTEDTLYVAASLWRLYDDEAVASGDRTVVRSVAVGSETLSPVSELDLGGYVADIAATPERLLVARNHWDGTGALTSRVAVVDIALSGGAMALGADIPVAGQVKSQFNMDLRGDILRVVSEGGWEDRKCHLETFDVSDINAPVAIDEETFGEGQSLFATLFVDADKGFFVTYLRQDPFHAFEIGPDGQAEEKSEFIVSGWNDFFRAVLGDTRLIGVGVDDASGRRKLAVSLYDITDLDNPEPLVARRSAEIEGAWSEASWDHRAFSVLEDAVSVPASETPETIETGLVLLPFSGWEEGGFRSGVELFTFSDTTLTARGILAHETPVRRAFETEEDVAACLSDVSLALHDVSDPDAPVKLGEVDVAPNYAEFDTFTSENTTFGLRHRESAGWNWWGSHIPTPGMAEVLSLDGDPDRNPPLARFDVPAGASITKVGNLAIVMSASWKLNENDPDGGAWQTTVAVWDLSVPTSPVKRSEYVTRDLPPYWSGWYAGVARPEANCLGCGGYGMAPRGTVVGDAIAFLEGVYESAPAGVQRYCVTSPPDAGGTVDGGPPTDPRERSAGSAGDGVYYTGRIECTRQGDGPESCFGEIYACTGFEAECTPVETPAAIGAKTECREDTTYRTWTRWLVHVLDLSDPDAPIVAEAITLPEVEEGVGILAEGATLWVSTREPAVVADDGRSYVRYWARAINLTNPSEPEFGTKLNVPGQLLAVENETLFLLDFVYDSDHVESAVSKVVVDGDVARLTARHRIEDRQVEAVKLDGAGHVLVSHGPTYWWYGYDVAGHIRRNGDDESWESKLTVLDAGDLTALSTTAIANWSSLRWAAAGRAIFQVPGGLLVMNLDDPTNPAPQSFFSISIWPEEVIVAGRRIIFAGGLYGLYAFGLDAFDLLPPAP